MQPSRRVSRVVYKQAFPILKEHLVIPGARNSHFKSEALLESLVYLSMEKTYAESGLVELS